MNSENVWFTISDIASERPAEVSVSAVNYQGSVQIKKVNKTGEGLTGAHFRLVNSQGEVIRKNLETAADGSVTASDLAPGTYYFEESQAPKGYLVNSEKVAVTVKESYEGQPKMEVGTSLVNYQGAAELLKTDEADLPLMGAQFSLVDEAGAEIQHHLTSNAEGKVKAENLAPGIYYFVETKAPTGYIRNTQKVKVEIASQAKGAPTVVNAGKLINYQGRISFEKVSGYDTRVALTDAVFSLSKVNGDTKELLNGNVVTRKDSLKIELTDLAPGHYVLEETKAPAGFIRRLEPIEFEIANHGNGEPTNAYTLNQELIFENYQGSAELIKTDQGGVALKGAVFSVLDQEGQAIQTGLTSDANGKVKAEKLAPGTYYFVETTAPSGYVLNTEKVKFEIAAESQDGHADLNKLSLINYQGAVELKKVDSQNQALAGAEFNLYRQNKGKDTLVAKELLSDEAGLITVSELAPGNYYFKEIKAPKGYILSNQPVDFVVPKEAEAAPVAVEVMASNYQGTAELIKTDQRGAGLKGAVFSVLDQEGQAIQTGLISDANGKVKAEKLAPGTYYFVETTAPSGYVLNTENVKFEIAAASQDGHADLNKLSLINYQGSVRLEKVNPARQPLEGAVFSLYQKQAGQDKLLSDGLVTDQQGLITVTKLAPGSYYFKETKAPTGYVLSSQEVAFTVADQAEGQPDLIERSITNEPIKSPTPLQSVKAPRSGKGGSDLPQAGNQSTRLLSIIGGSLIVGALVVRRKRKSA